MPLPDRLKATPLGIIALAAAAGVVVAEHAAFIAPVVWAALALTAIAAAWGRSGALPIAAAAAATFGLMHAANMRGAVSHPFRKLLLSRPSAAVDIVARGRIEKPLRRDLPGAVPGAAWFHSEEVSVPVLGMKFHGPTTFKVFAGKTAAPAPGEYMITGRARLPRPADNPGQFDAEDYELHRGLAAELLATKLECVRADSWNVAATIDAAAEASRQWITKTLGHSLEDATPERTVTLAMVIGGAEANADADDLEKPFRETGTIHVFAVAGLHVGIVGYILWMFLRPLGAPRGVLLAILIPCLFGYAFVTGLRPSSVRAAVMAAVFLSGAIFNRRSSVLNSLGVAALIMLAFDTNQLFSIGFQMSFSVIAAIAICEPIIRRPFRALVEHDPFLPKSLLTPVQRYWAAFKHWVLGLFSVSAAATVGSVPCMVGYFGLITPVSVLANIVLVPITFLVIFTAMLRLAFGLIHLHGIQALLGHSNWLFARLALLGAKFFAAFPGASYYIAPPSLHSQPTVQMTVLRMPKGGAAQHLHAGDKDWLLDCGGARDFKHLLRPYLQHSGVNRISGVVLSHGDFEHIGGTAPLLADYRVGALYESVLEPWPWTSGSSTTRRLHAAGIHPQTLTAGDKLVFGPDCRATVLYPSGDLTPRRADDRSLVLRIETGAFRILWCNDVGFVTEKTLLERHTAPALQADIIIRNQNAGDFSMLPEFLNAVRPRCIISSNNDLPVEEKLPASLRRACQERGITLVDQLQTGAVTLRLWPQRLDIVPFRGTSSVITLMPGR